MLAIALLEELLEKPKCETEVDRLAALEISRMARIFRLDENTGTYSMHRAKPYTHPDTVRRIPRAIGDCGEMLYYDERSTYRYRKHWELFSWMLVFHWC